MGKTTLYHPISLYVIRGAAQYCGFEFGKIKQLFASVEGGRAVYTADITKMPRDLMKSGSLLRIHHDLQECFMDDIRIDWVHVKQSGLWSCKITVNLTNIDSQASLIPNPDPTIEPIHGGGGGGGGEADKIFATISDEGFAVCHFCKNKLFWSQIYKYVEGDQPQLISQSGLECRYCWSLYDMNFVLIQRGDGPDYQGDQG